MKCNPGMALGTKNLMGLHPGSIFTGLECFLALFF
jgi:hypothetical protein